MTDQTMPFEENSQMLREIWPFVDAHRRAGNSVVLARLVGRDGPGARPIGATMAVAADGTWRGSLSGGCVEGFVLDAAREVLGGDSPARILSVLPAEHLLPWEQGPACSGELRVLITPAPPAAVHSAITLALAHDTQLAIRIELRSPYTWAVSSRPGSSDCAAPAFTEMIGRRRKLVLVGATDLAAIMAELAQAMHFAVVVLDPRPGHLGSRAFPSTATLVRAWADEWLTAHPLDAQDALVTVSHDPRIDDRALEAALAGRARYVAALGSRATHAQRLRRLTRSVESQRLRGPAGLDLGGITLAETAVSILAEIVATENGRVGGPLRHGDRPIHTLPEAAHV
ncbi:XdhC family protein [Nocardia sp. NPDC051990]|uniref:XdhC family protein n=1 Tax=Nocardia sp. NPDC051990 TaxID=3155285 RepID=UPI003421A2F7